MLIKRPCKGFLLFTFYIFLTCRKEFRPCYGKLGLLSSIFPNIPILALTATATVNTKKEIVSSLALMDPKFIEINPDRPNIFFSSCTRPSHGDDKLSPILSPLVHELLEMRQYFPLTLIYGNLQTISECFCYFSNKMGCLQYHPIGAAPIATNRMFSQFHAQYPDHEHERIVRDLVSSDSKLRIMFVTVAFGIGIDVPNIRRVIHIGVPYTLEEYFQEAGRCGRDGQPATAAIYYNAYDISTAKRSMAPSMREYVKSDKCKREMILSHFGYKPPKRVEADHTCCDHHRKNCQCEDCLLVHAVEGIDFKESINTSTTTTKSLSKEQNEKLREELLNFRASLHGSAKTCVGSISLASGFSMELVDLVIASAPELTSLGKIKAELPVFDEDHAKAIHEILTKNTCFTESH